MEDEWKKGQDAYQHWQNEYVRMQVEYDSAVKQVNNAREKREETFARFANELEQGGFPDQSAYKEAKRTDTEIAELQQKIKRYYSSLEVLAKQIEELTNELQDKEWMDIISIEEQMKKLDIELDITKEKRQRAQSAVEYISDLYEKY